MQNNSSSLNKSRRFFNHNGKGLKNALVIDDQKIDCFIAEKFILQYDQHASVQSFNTVSSALRHLRKLKKADFPDLIVLDMKLPIYNGNFFIRELLKLRQFDPGQCRLLPVSCYTSFFDPNVQQRLKEVFPFMPECRQKPLSREMIEEVIAY